MREQGREHYNLKNKVAYVVFAVLVILVFIVVCLIFFLKKNREDSAISDLEVTLEQGGVVNTSWAIDALDLRPGSSTEYTLIVHGKESGSYAIKLDFETDEECPLAKYITVTVKCEDEVWTELSLEEFLGGKYVERDYEFDTNEDKRFTVTYTMGDAGNEAQGATANFELTLTAHGKGEEAENA